MDQLIKNSIISFLFNLINYILGKLFAIFAGKMNSKIKFKRGIKMISEIRYKPIRNFCIDWYLGEYARRRTKTQKPSIILLNKLTLACCIVKLVTIVVSLLVELDRETSMLLFDLSVFFGGSKTYTKFSTILLMITAIGLNYETRLKTYEEQWDSLIVFEICRSRVRKLFVGYDKVLDKMAKLIKIVYKWVTLSIITFSKYQGECLSWPIS